MHFGQVITAMVTPFDHEGNIDFFKTTKLVNFLIANGSDGLVIAGTTGESSTLSTEEKLSLFQHVVKAVNKRVPVIAGTGGNNTQASVSLTKKAAEVGVDGIMAVTPYYNKPCQIGLYEHFKAIAEASSLPVMLYNIPGRCVINISADTIVKLSEINNIVAVKEASGDLDQITLIIANTPTDFLVYSGDDGLTLPILAVGGQGIVSVASHIIGNEIQAMINSFKSGNYLEAAKAHQRLLPFMKGLFIAPNPVPLKAALQCKGLDVGGVRLPLVPLSSEDQKTMSCLLRQL